MMSLKAKVWRDNTQHLIDSSHVVPGDLIIVNEGDTIPADGYLLSASNLESTEAALTGESLPVSKSLSPIDHEVVLADQKNMLFS